MSSYRLTRDQLLEYPGLNGSRARCHLRVYEARRDSPVCILGNFDGGLGTTTTNAVEVVATRVAEQIGTRKFRLIEWYPHDYAPFVEPELKRVRPTTHAYGQVLIAGEPHDETVRTGHSAIVRFVDPRWTALSEDELEELLGGEALRELQDLAGEPGDYTAEWLFGATGREWADSVRRDNRALFDALEARIKEWTLGQ
jgi:hypothetical protein